MKTIDVMSIQTELHDMHIVHAKCMLWRMRCLAHRLVSFGWEDAVAHLGTVETLMLAAMLPMHMHDTLVESAYDHADARWRAFIERECPRLTEAAHV